MTLSFLIYKMGVNVLPMRRESQKKGQKGGMEVWVGGGPQ